MTNSAGTIQGGEGGVTKGDIDLLFEDADNELKNLASLIGRAKFDMAKLMSKFANLVEQYEYHASGTVSRTGSEVPQMGGTDGSGGTGRRALRQQLTLDGATGQRAGTKAEAAQSGKAFSSKKKEGT